MFKLEHGEKDSAKSKKAAPIIDRLQDHRDRWKDDYTANRVLRDHFRVSINVPIPVSNILSIKTLILTFNDNFDITNPNFDNKTLIDVCQAKKKDLKEKAAVDAALLSKSSLDIVLLPQIEEDAKIASLLQLNSKKSKSIRK